MNQAIADQIKRLAQKQNALILAHNYQPPEIQGIADMCGDSLELSIKAAETEAGVLVFCGVHFMAETASILCPEKKVLLPRADAGCPMADMVTPEALKEKNRSLTGVPVITYVNSPAAVKAISTVCCTSANSVKVANSLDAGEILMVPDRNLAAYTAAHTDKTVHCWDGCCPYHERLTPEMVRQVRQAHPNALFMAHPECRPEVTAMADVVTSTSGMLNFANQSDHSEFIVGTEVGLIYPLGKASPGKSFYPASDRMYCADMKKITLADVARSLEQLSGEVRVPEDVRVPALSAVKKMLMLR
ncbi:MAG: quinolinate synthase NadA [Desulfobacterales bacterium]|nr:quinolinate synthase NadA [Desulfobacterales bacterium]MBS3756280.1 quinolinate synthase NadA [Desulfobacterales bacterium]